MKTLNKLASIATISLLLTACTHTEKVGNMELAIYEGAFDSSITGVTMRGDDNKITIQQVVVSDGIASILVKESAKVGAAATFGVAAAPLYKPAQTKTTTNVKNGGSNVSNNSGSNASNTNQAVATGATANATGLGGNATGGQGGVGGTSSALGGNGGVATSVASPVSTVSSTGGASNVTSTVSPVTTSFGGRSSANSDSESNSRLNNTVNLSSDEGRGNNQDD